MSEQVAEQPAMTSDDAEASQATTPETTGRRARTRRAGRALLGVLLSPVLAQSAKVEDLASTIRASRASRTPGQQPRSERVPRAPGRRGVEVIGDVVNLGRVTAQAVRRPGSTGGLGSRLRQDPNVQTALVRTSDGRGSSQYAEHLIKRLEASQQQAGTQAETAPVAAVSAATGASAPATMTSTAEAGASQQTQAPVAETTAQPPLSQQPQTLHNVIPPTPEV